MTCWLPTRVSTPVQTKISQLSLAGKELGETPATKELLGLFLCVLCVWVGLFACAFARACVRACVRACACAGVHCIWQWLRAWPCIWQWQRAHARAHRACTRTSANTHTYKTRGIDTGYIIIINTGHLMMIAAQIGREHCPEGCRLHFVRGSCGALLVAVVPLLFCDMPFVGGIPCIRHPFLSAPSPERWCLTLRFWGGGPCACARCVRCN
jgi:hypothetical protein